MLIFYVCSIFINLETKKEMEDIVKINKAIDEYNTRYNTHFHVGNKYSLFPKGEEYGYKDEWPGNKHAGVYFVMSENDHLLYVGQSKDLGQRLYQHFPPSGERENPVCTFKENWSMQPYFLYVSITPDDAIWERLSLEEFLIQKFNPIDNISGKIK